MNAGSSLKLNANRQTDKLIYKNYNCGGILVFYKSILILIVLKPLLLT
jgi:hypothetical protein